MNYYEVLQVMSTASPEVIQMAYKALAKKYHPDVFQGNKEYAESQMKLINEAYMVLSSPVSRQEYDRRLQQEKEQAKQTYQTDQATQQRRQDPVQKKRGFSLHLGWVLIATIIIGVILLDNPVLLSEKDNEIPVKETTAPATTIPRSGDILSGSECFGESELTITASSGSSCVVKLKTGSGVERLSFYVRSGDTVTVGVPAEHLYVYFASGEIWYGTNLLFGDETYYSMDDKILDFSEYTWEYTLYPVSSGNFSETPINPDDF